MSKGSMLPSIMNHSFSRVSPPEIQRSVFQRDSTMKTTFDEGDLIPVYVDECLPGDTYNMSATFFARMATPIFPIMDNLFLDHFWFYVPYRILWENWERFNGAQDNPGDSIDFSIPYCEGNEPGQAFTPGAQTLGDHFGLPIQVLAGDDAPSALPFRAYNLIWNEWFRDQNLQNKVSVPINDGPDTGPSYVLLKRGKKHDYFTSCLPWPQKGDSTPIPLGTTAPVIGNTSAIGLINQNAGSPASDRRFGLFGNAGINDLQLSTTTYGLTVGAAAVAGNAPNANVAIGLSRDPATSGMVADLSAATAATINQLREAFAIQQVLERDARGGTRYIELLKAHFGVEVPDYRLQRPEYLGGGSTPIDIHGVAQTSSTDATTPQGNLSAYGQVVARGGFTKSIVEHGLIMCLVNVRADITYQQGMERFWSRRTRYDFYLPALAHLGEMPVYNREIFMSASEATNGQVFGYQERWADYRYKPSKITGLFRSDASGSLDAWHLSTDFPSTPALNASFIQDDPPVSRVVAVITEPHFLFDSFFKLRHARPLPMFSNPGLQRL